MLKVAPYITCLLLIIFFNNMNFKKCIDSLYILCFVLKNDHNFKSCTKKMFSILFSVSSIISYNFFYYVSCALHPIYL